LGDTSRAVVFEVVHQDASLRYRGHDSGSRWPSQLFDWGARSDDLLDLCGFVRVCCSIV